MSTQRGAKDTLIFNQTIHRFSSNCDFGLLTVFKRNGMIDFLSRIIAFDIVSKVTYSAEREVALGNLLQKMRCHLSFLFGKCVMPQSGHKCEMNHGTSRLAILAKFDMSDNFQHSQLVYISNVCIFQADIALVCYFLRLYLRVKSGRNLVVASKRKRQDWNTAPIDSFSYEVSAPCIKNWRSFYSKFLPQCKKTTESRWREARWSMIPHCRDPANERREPTASYRWTGWVWEITCWSSKFTENFRGIYGICFQLIKKKPKGQNILLVGLGNTRISTYYVQKYPRILGACSSSRLLEKANCVSNRGFCTVLRTESLSRTNVSPL